MALGVGIVLVLAAGVAGAVVESGDDTTGAATDGTRERDSKNGVPSLAGSILYISNRGFPPPQPVRGPVIPTAKGFNLWVMGPDGRDQRRLTDTGFDAQPSLSPDGTRIVWVVRNNEIWTMNSDGSGRAHIASCPMACSFPKWSPEGSRIAYVTQSRSRGDDRVVVVGADGSRPNRYHTDFTPYSVTWSPEGEKLAVTVTGSPETAGLWTLDLESAAQRRIRTGNSLNPDWSPDGKAILFSDGVRMYTISPDGTGQRQISIGRGQFLGGSWSSDGTVIAYDYYPGRAGTKQQVWAMAADGTGARPLSDAGADCYEASF